MWRLVGRTQHQRDKGRLGWAFDGGVLLPQFTPPPKQTARGDPVPARYRRDGACGPSRHIDNG